MPKPSEPHEPQISNTPKQKPESDIFALETTFPEADAVFTARPKSLQEVKDLDLFVLDTNTLLLPYLTGSKTLTEIKSTYEKLITAKRLLIPARVAREFASNRSRKIGEVYHALTDQQSRQQFSPQENYPLLEGISEYKELREVGRKLQDLMKEYRKAFGDVIKKVESWEWDDPISALYSDLFTPELIISQSLDTDSQRKAHAYRFANKIPPGYMDGGKADDGIGDLVIWQTILEIGKSFGKGVIFVTGEKKADWWHNSNKQQLYPRYELVDEFRRSSGGNSFHIITFSQLLEMFGASDTVVAEVRSEERIAPRRVKKKKSFSLAAAQVRAKVVVRTWFEDLGFEITVGGLMTDFTAVRDTEEYRVEIDYFQRLDGEIRLQEWLNNARDIGSNAKTLIAVCGKADFASRLLRILAKSGLILTYTVGIIGTDGKFQPLWSKIK